MAQVLVRDLDADVVERLKERAKAHKRSLEAELRVILQQAAQSDRRQGMIELERIRAMLAGRTFDDSTESLREDRAR